LNYVLVGTGRMGRAVEVEARRRGHAKVAELDSSSGDVFSRGGSLAAAVAGAEVAFEFTAPAAAERNVSALVRAGIPVVCGTTGWTVSDGLRAEIERSETGVVIAPNFSVGVLLFTRLAAQAARLFGSAGQHRPWILESHHTGKKDAPSGTAHRLAEVVMAADPRIHRVQFGNPDGRLAEDALHVVSVRAAGEPGTHTVGFGGEHDRIELTHAARSRAGFALGAVIAAEWLKGRRGMHDFEEVVDSATGQGGD